MNNLEYEALRAICDYCEKKVPKMLPMFAETYLRGKVRVTDTHLKDTKRMPSRPAITTYDRLERQVWSYVV